MEKKKKIVSVNPDDGHKIESKKVCDDGFQDLQRVVAGALDFAFLRPGTAASHPADFGRRDPFALELLGLFDGLAFAIPLFLPLHAAFLAAGLRTLHLVADGLPAVEIVEPVNAFRAVVDAIFTPLALRFVLNIGAPNFSRGGGASRSVGWGSCR